MLQQVLDALIDSVKLLPFLFVTYLLMEYIEDKLEDKSRVWLRKAGHVGPVWGAALGIIPQCGLSAAASSLYAGRVITMGTLIAIYLSTSDEMLPILISEAISPIIIGKILLVKFVTGMVIGFVVDLFARLIVKIPEQEVDIHHFCEHENCSCGQGILRPAIKHTLTIFVFILIIEIVLNIIVGATSIETISNTVFSRPVAGALLAGIIGLIPNCGASVALTSLYLQGVMSFGTMIAGLLVGAGVGVLILLKVNENKKQNVVIISTLYVSGVVVGIIINLLGISI